MSLVELIPPGYNIKGVGPSKSTEAGKDRKLRTDKISDLSSPMLRSCGGLRLGIYPAEERVSCTNNVQFIEGNYVENAKYAYRIVHRFREYSSLYQRHIRIPTAFQHI